MIRTPWHRVKAWLDGPRILWSVGAFFGGIAILIAMSLAFGNHHDDQRTIHQQSNNIDRLQTQVDRLQSQVDSNGDVADCRARLAAVVTLRTADQVQAIGQLVVTIAANPKNVNQAVADLSAANTALKAAIGHRQTFENDPTQPCPIPSATAPLSGAVGSSTTTTTSTTTKAPVKKAKASTTTTTRQASTTTSTIYPSVHEQPGLCQRLLGNLNPGIVCPIEGPS